MRKAYCIGLLLCLPLIGAAQGGYVFTEFSYADFSMKRMKSFQQYITQTSGIPQLRTLSTFPGFGEFGVGWGKKQNGNTHAYGFMVSYTSTGGRSYYEDYSGLVVSDILLSQIAFRVFFQHQIKYRYAEQWPIFYELYTGYARSALNVTNTIQVGGPASTDKIDAHAVSYLFRPSLLVERRFGQFFVQGKVGYEVYVNRRVYLNSDGGIYLDTGYGDELRIDWSGMRLSLTAGLRLHKDTK